MEAGPRRGSRTRQLLDRLGFGRLQYPASHRSGSALLPPPLSGDPSTSGSALSRAKPPPPEPPPLPTRERISRGRLPATLSDSLSQLAPRPAPGGEGAEAASASPATLLLPPGAKEAGEGAQQAGEPASHRHPSGDSLDALVLTRGLGLDQHAQQGTAPPPPPPPQPAPPPSRPPPAPSPPGAPPKAKGSARIRSRPIAGISPSQPNLSDQPLLSVVNAQWHFPFFKNVK